MHGGKKTHWQHRRHSQTIDGTNRRSVRTAVCVPVAVAVCVHSLCLSERDREIALVNSTRLKRHCRLRMWLWHCVCVAVCACVRAPLALVHHSLPPPPPLLLPMHVCILYPIRTHIQRDGQSIYTKTYPRVWNYSIIVSTKWYSNWEKPQFQSLNNSAFRQRTMCVSAHTYRYRRTDACGTHIWTWINMRNITEWKALSAALWCEWEETTAI